MNTLKGTICYLRALEISDLDFLFSTENNEDFWEFSNTQLPYSKFILHNYIKNAHQDIYEAKQYRFVICENTNSPVGMIDLYDFNPQQKRVGIGLLVLPQFQLKGFATEALQLIINYAFTYLNIHQVYATISVDNHKSITLFEKLNFKKSGIKKDWLFVNGNFKDEVIYQLIKN